MTKDKDLFGEDIKTDYFIACPSAEDKGFIMADCGCSNGDGGVKWVVTTNGLKSDEIPEECCDAKTFAELVAKLLNNYYNKK